MGAGDQTGCAYLPVTCQSYLDVSGVPYHANCTRPIPSQSLDQLEQSLLTCRVHGFMRLYPYPNTSISSIQLEPRLGRPGNVSSHQQSNVSVDGPRRGVKLCVVQSLRVHKWSFGSESPYR
ncbi:hypothetical protein AVEN_188945-1 [Araneus ventricosus]|uniref:Uncharacterized protein n=1 Tax=Araneus ventricosus TaxID=182803 RepID=A0A4Y2V7M6_ARAVE|nr:hypothetical protein AVEN_188945-1 [Araneus ventricosus]